MLLTNNLLSISGFLNIKNIFFSLIILAFFSEINSSCFAQTSGRITYTTILESEDYKELEGVLLINDGITSFFVQENSDLHSKNSQEEDLKFETHRSIDLGFSIEPPRDSIMYQVFIDINQNQIRSRRSVFRDGQYLPCIVIEPTDMINWEIINESKKIGSFTANKAKTSFRGRNYTAWYTTDVKINAGPWKFHGLPGLILEIIDDEKGVQFIISSEIIPYEFKEDFISPKEDLVLTIEEYAFYNDPNIIAKEFIEWVSSKLPEGATIIDPSSISIHANYKGIEREFE